jgi:type VI secretion system protein ImpK
MSTQDVAKVLTAECPNTIPKGYFRSRLFATNYANNQLLDAASPILSLLERLCVSPNLPDIDQMRANIEHELFAFNSRLTNQQYVDEFKAIAHYLLYATIDELLAKNYMRLYGNFAGFKAFTPSAVDGVGPEFQFFNIINYLKERTNQYLDLIELAYYCLITGFEGNYHVRANGRQLLDDLIEELHQIILKKRVNKTHTLFKETYNPPPEPKNYKPIFILSALFCCALAFTYFGSHQILERQAYEVLNNPNTRIV